MQLFWTQIEQLLAESRVIIDRPKGSEHPRVPGCIYPLDYGYLERTKSSDGEGIDVWIGSQASAGLVGVIFTVDLPKREIETKLLIACSDGEIETVKSFFARLQMGHSVVISPASARS
jgi:inorganic pyrophosphatase